MRKIITPVKTAALNESKSVSYRDKSISKPQDNAYYDKKYRHRNLIDEQDDRHLAN